MNHVLLVIKTAIRDAYLIVFNSYRQRAITEKFKILEATCEEPARP